MDTRGKITRGKLFCLFLFLIMTLVALPGIAMAQVHMVSKGDTIHKIAGSYNVSQFALRYTNNVWTDNIYPGQNLTIPQKYTVQKGDTLFLIGKKFGVDYNRIKATSNLKSNSINPGQTLYIPVGRAVTTTTSRGSFNWAEIDALARIITAEAASESYITQVAVGAVVLNRVDSSLFPNTIRGVVYQVDAGGKYQFEPVLNGWINRPANGTAKKAAKDALNGWDPSNGALYFWEHWVTNKYLTA
ncbi:MAG: cell wall hydrolase, partial [Desulfotomaculaceae bacterium]